MAQSSPQPIRYMLRFPAPATHYVEVEAVYPTDGRPQVELMMAVWTPGSYLVREYERHVEALTVTAEGGRALAVVKPVKNRWRIATGGAATITVRYRVYGREMTVRNNWVEQGFGTPKQTGTFYAWKIFFYALFGLIIASVVNLFMASSAIYWLTTYAGILIFVGLTAWDTHKIKNMAQGQLGDQDMASKASIMGALILYLDFINLFLYLLRLFGNGRRN